MSSRTYKVSRKLVPVIVFQTDDKASVDSRLSDDYYVHLVSDGGGLVGVADTEANAVALAQADATVAFGTNCLYLERSSSDETRWVAWPWNTK